MVTLIPEMKSGTPKTCTMTPNTGQLNNSVKVFDELVLCLLPPSWILPPGIPK